MKRLFLLLFLFLFVFSLASCKTTETPKEFNPKPISTILTTGVNNEKIKVEGVVYGVISNGFYVADSSEGAVFVTMGSSWTPNVNEGDKVQITGQFSLVNNFPQIKSVSKLTVVSSNNTSAVTTAEGSVTSITSLSPTAKKGSYASVYNLTVTVGKNGAGTYYLADDDAKSILVYASSNVEALETKLNSRVSLKVIVHNFVVSENKWQVSFVGKASEIINTPLSFDDIIAKALEDVQKTVSTEIYGKLSLPKEHSINQYISYSWSVEPNDYLVINEDGTVLVNYDEQDHVITLKLTISDGNESQTVDYPITSKGIVERTVGDLLDNTPTANMSVVIVSGIVVGIARNQSLSLRSYIIQDQTTLQTTTVDFANTGDYILNTSDEFKSVEVGDIICVKGEYRSSDRPTIMNVSMIEKRSSKNEYQHDFENAFVLKDATSYQEFGNNYKLYLNKLVKIENPYLNFSTSTIPSDTNWVRLGHDETSGNLGFGLDASKRYFAFLIAAQNESLGNDSWYKMFDIPFVNNPAIQQEGYFYAYALYVSETYLAFLIPDWNCWRFSDQLIIERDLGLNIPATSEGETIVLPTTHEKIQGTITWSSSHPDIINPTTGVINSVNELTEVTLSATYLYNSQNVVTEYIVVVRPSVALTVSEILSTALDGQMVKVKGVIVGYSSDGNNNAARDGIIIMDNETGQMLLINGMKYVYSENEYGAYCDKDGTLLTMGDEVVIIGSYFENAAAIGKGGVQTGRAHIQLTDNALVQRISTGNQINYNYNEAIVIDSDAALQALADNLQYGKLIKFVGTADAPLYIGGSSSSFPLNIKFFYKNAIDNNGTKYNGVIFSLKTDVNIANAGNEWWEDVFDIYEPFVGPSSTVPSIPCVGEIYVVVSALTSTYIQMSIVDADSITTKRILTKEQLDGILTIKLPTAVEPGEMDFSLPTTSKYVTGPITWTSSSPLIDLETKTISKVNENTSVTLKAQYIFEDVEFELEHIITILAPAKPEPLSVSELLETGVDNAEVEVVGYFAGYQSDGNTSGLLRGIILIDKDTSDTILIDGVETLGGDYGAYINHEGTLLAVGDELVIKAKYTVLSGRQSITLSAQDTINIISNNNDITWALDKAIVISNHDELLAFANNPQFGVIIKFVGTIDDPFLFGGSSSNPSSINYKLFYNKEAVKNDDTKYNGATFSFKKVVNQPNAGENWWSELFDLPEAFIAPTDSYPSIQKTGVIYAVLNAKTSSYYQLSLVNVSGCQVVALP